MRQINLSFTPAVVAKIKAGEVTFKKERERERQGSRHANSEKFKLQDPSWKLRCRGTFDRRGKVYLTS